MPRGRKQFRAEQAWLVAYGVLGGLAGAGLILLLGMPRRGEPIQLLVAPTAVASAVVAEPRAATLTPLVAPKLPLDLNTATLAELEYLPGIGPSTALAIVSYRERYGLFESVEQLLEIPGIGPRTLEGLRPFAYVETDED